ncbi:MAG TPA: hypothetical protein VJP79_00765 [Nitrososphaera sp.]|nr:hypothetical protein [Nitrososphaera sp.]
MDAIEATLFSATKDAIASLGESTLQAFRWYLRHEGMSFSKDDMDISEIESTIEQFFGSASPTIIQMVYQRFMIKAMSEGHFTQESISSLVKLPSSSNTRIILRLAARRMHKLS